MDKFDFALTLIRSPWLKRLVDRTFLQTIAAASTAIGAAYAIWQTPGVPVDQKINVTLAAIAAVGTVVTAWNYAEKKKDTEIAKAAFEGTTPETLNAAAVLTPPLTPASLSPAGLSSLGLHPPERERRTETDLEAYARFVPPELWPEDPTPDNPGVSSIADNIGHNDIGHDNMGTYHEDLNQGAALNEGEQEEAYDAYLLMERAVREQEAQAYSPPQTQPVPHQSVPPQSVPHPTTQEVPHGHH